MGLKGSNSGQNESEGVKNAPIVDKMGQKESKQVLRGEIGI